MSWLENFYYSTCTTLKGPGGLDQAEAPATASAGSTGGVPWPGLLSFGFSCVVVILAVLLLWRVSSVATRMAAQWDSFLRSGGPSGRQPAPDHDASAHTATLLAESTATARAIRDELLNLGTSLEGDRRRFNARLDAIDAALAAPDPARARPEASAATAQPSGYDAETLERICNGLDDIIADRMAGLQVGIDQVLAEVEASRGGPVMAAKIDQIVASLQVIAGDRDGATSIADLANDIRTRQEEALAILTARTEKMLVRIEAEREISRAAAPRRRAPPLVERVIRGGAEQPPSPATEPPGPEDAPEPPNSLVIVPDDMPAVVAAPPATPSPAEAAAAAPTEPPASPEHPPPQAPPAEVAPPEMDSPDIRSPEMPGQLDLLAQAEPVLAPPSAASPVAVAAPVPPPALPPLSQHEAETLLAEFNAILAKPARGTDVQQLPPAEVQRRQLADFRRRYRAQWAYRVEGGLLIDDRDPGPDRLDGFLYVRSTQSGRSGGMYRGWVFPGLNFFHNRVALNQPTMLTNAFRDIYTPHETTLDRLLNAAVAQESGSRLTITSIGVLQFSRG